MTLTQIPAPELQINDELTKKALKQFAADDSLDDGEVTAAAVYSVVDPNPSRGYFLVAVCNGSTAVSALGTTIEEAVNQLNNWVEVQDRLGF